MSGRVIRVLVVLSVFSIIGIISLQIGWVMNAYALRERQFRQSAFIALQEVADQVTRLNRITQSRYAVTQLSADYFIVNTQSPIDPVTLEYYIQTSLRKHNIFTDFEYGIYNCESDRMVYGAYVSVQSPDTTARKVRHLPTFPRYIYYFGIRFPGQARYLAGQLDHWIISSVVVLVVVLFFGYTLVLVLRQRRLTEVQRDFINNMTHELQTPVATIRIAADVLQSEDLLTQPERHRQYTRVLREESLRLQKQVNNVLQLARTERLRLTLNRTELDLHQLLTEAALLFSPHVTLRLEARHSVINADRYHLENVINNLLDNAVKYTTGPPRIVLHTHNEGNTLVWSVQDNGIGIAKKHQDVIFRQFYRVSTGNIHDVKGFGLGLFYVRKVVRAHRWHIRLRSEPGNGSEFIITFGA